MNPDTTYGPIGLAEPSGYDSVLLFQTQSLYLLGRPTNHPYTTRDRGTARFLLYYQHFSLYCELPLQTTHNSETET